MLAALRDDQEGIDRFFGVFAGTVPVTDFFGDLLGASSGVPAPA